MFCWIPHDGEFSELLGQDLNDAELLQSIMDAPKTRHDQWQVQTLLQIGEKATIHMYSTLKPDDHNLSRTEKCNDLSETIQRIAGDYVTDGRCPIAVLPRGPLTIPSVL